MKDDKAVIDIDLRWAGNAEFVLEAGVKPVPLMITLNKICFSGRMRVELAPLVPVFPCFGAGAGLADSPQPLPISSFFFSVHPSFIVCCWLGSGLSRPCFFSYMVYVFIPRYCLVVKGAR